jgi:hypothetical protein
VVDTNDPSRSLYARGSAVAEQIRTESALKRFTVVAHLLGERGAGQHKQFVDAQAVRALDIQQDLEQLWTLEEC